MEEHEEEQALVPVSRSSTEVSVDVLRKLVSLILKAEDSMGEAKKFGETMKVLAVFSVASEAEKFLGKPLSVEDVKGRTNGKETSH